ncbi:hypothetical protein B0H17DRAFT_1064128, partial [Mycena rosella]
MPASRRAGSGWGNSCALAPRRRSAAGCSPSSHAPRGGLRGRVVSSAPSFLLMRRGMGTTAKTG